MEINAELNQEKVGSIQKVLIDRLEGNQYVGRTEADSPEVDNEVWIAQENQYLRLGDFSEVLIESAGPYDLYGKTVAKD
jgi:ribosomal protein S12 methylthiotransferase